ncbi:MAG: hypothetical protein HYU84_17310, partial [Chloroflexi bacterium]|nr:hypothetical protein [Chloroflexota bacterium]
MSQHQHSHIASEPSHQPPAQGKWIAKFFGHMHNTEVWASHLPRIPGYISALAIVGVILVIASFTGPWAGSSPFKFISLLVGFLLALPALVMGGFALRKWKYAQQLRKEILDSIQWRGDENVLDIGCGSGLLLNGAAMRL